MRLFIAVELSATPAIRELLTELGRLGSLFKVVDAEHLHVTLRFIGESAEGVDALAEQVDRAVEGVSWFNLRLRSIGTFPPGRTDGKRMPRVIYAAAEDAEPLHIIAGRLASPGDRPFTAHLTLARHRVNRRPSRAQRERLAGLFERYGEADFGVVPVRAVCLIHSELSAAGPRYSVLRRAVLGV